MKAKDLHLLELLNIKPDEGSISFKNRRMLLWDADAFGSLRKELIDSLGVERARPILKRFGFANGYRDARTTGDLFRWDDDREWWLSCPALQRHEGKVKPTVDHLVVDREAGQFEMSVTWEHSYEAEQHRRVYGRSEKPVCWTLTGFASGFATALMGQEVFVIETECAAMGGSACRVEGRTRAAWGEAGDSHAADFEACPLAAELEAREAELRQQQRALERRETELADAKRATNGKTNGVIWRSRAMEDVLDLARTVARVDSTVLITGESGVGKERVARFVHDQSRRADGPFIAVNCGALPETLLESELFGHVKGAFTGAERDKKGLFEAADGGTIFLDEVGEMSPAIQVRLLRVLQEREVLPVGATAPRSLDVRVVAATNRDLESMVRNGEFRTDLYYRLKVVSVAVPPLRVRIEDILPLAREFVVRACQSYELDAKTLSPEVVQAFTEYPWPGNVRELQNAVERAVVLSADRNKIFVDELPPEMRSASEAAFSRVLYDQVMPIAELERRYVLEVLNRFEGNRTHTARALGIGANTLWRKLKSWGVPPARGEVN